MAFCLSLELLDRFESDNVFILGYYSDIKMRLKFGYFNFMR